MEEKDTQETTQELDFTPVEGERPVPVGWRILFWGLVAFGAYYLWAYSPWASGWSQAGELTPPGAAPEGTGASILATILFTALAVVAAALLLFALARRKRRP